MLVIKPLNLRLSMQTYKKNLWRQLCSVMIDSGFLEWILFIYFILQIALADCNYLV